MTGSRGDRRPVKPASFPTAQDGLLVLLTVVLVAGFATTLFLTLPLWMTLGVSGLCGGAIVFGILVTSVVG